MKPYKRPEITSGDLDKPVEFFVIGQSSGPEVGMDGEPEVLYFCMADVYESSMKDIERNQTVSAKNMVTMKIRDTYGEYLPQTEHKFEIRHHNYPHKYNVIDVAPDTSESGFIKVVGEAYG